MTNRDLRMKRELLERFGDKAADVVKFFLEKKIDWPASDVAGKSPLENVEARIKMASIFWKEILNDLKND